MNILVATDGILEPELVAEAVQRWHADGDMVTVVTAVNVPTDFLRGLGEGGVEEASRIALEAGQTLGAGDRAAERLIHSLPAQATAMEDSPVLRALEHTARARTRPVVDALRKRGIEARATWRTSENRTAQTIIAMIREIDAGLVVIGSHGHGRFDGLLGSTGTKLVRHAPSAVLVLRTRPTG